MIFSDLTKQALDSAENVGDRVKIAMEIKILNVVLGLTNPHVWNGTAYNTYLTTGTNWINAITGLSVVDWTAQISQLEQLFVNLLDPVTLEANPHQAHGGCWSCPSSITTWKRLLNATNTRSGNFATTGTPQQIEATNPLEADYPVVKSASWPTSC